MSVAGERMFPRRCDGGMLEHAEIPRRAELLQKFCWIKQELAGQTDGGSHRKGKTRVRWRYVFTGDAVFPHRMKFPAKASFSVECVEVHIPFAVLPDDGAEKAETGEIGGGILP